MTNIVDRLRKSYPCRHQDEDDPHTKTTDTCVDSQSMCLCEYQDKKEAANEIERLQTGLHHYACECESPCCLYGMSLEKCGATAWEALHDRKKFSDMETANTTRKLGEETVSSL